MSPKKKAVGFQVAAALIAVGLLYLALKSVDFGAMWEVLRTANYLWLGPLFLVVLLSHYMRAWRWRMLLDALPEVRSRPTDKPVTTLLSFYSVMIGYMVNNAVPRLGEFARAANLSAQTRLSFVGVFGTVVIERILDVLVLILFLVWVTFLVAGLPAADQILFDPLRGLVGGIGLLEIALIAGFLIAFVVAVALLRRVLRQKSKAGGSAGRILSAIRAFKEGILTVFRSPHRIGLVVTTVAMWACYALMLYIPFAMLDMTVDYGLGFEEGIVLLVAGSLGFLVPAPGGIGAYHYVMIQTLTLFYAVDSDVAAGFAVLTHAAQLLFFAVGGFVCLLLQGSSFSAIWRSTQRAREIVDESAPTT
jgi:uncharacterized protein (TIRG00374 family)